MTIEEGASAPEFEAEDQDGETVRLSDFSGRKLALYFYPRDDTPGCTREACSLRDGIDSLEEQGVEVVGVSADTAESHRKFAEKYGLPFTLLADPEKEIIDAYGVEGRSGNASRVTFLIDEEGTVEKVYRAVDVENHADQILEGL